MKNKNEKKIKNDPNKNTNSRWEMIKTKERI